MTFSRYIVRDGVPYVLRPLRAYRDGRYSAKDDTGTRRIVVVREGEIVHEVHQHRYRRTQRDDNDVLMFWCSVCKRFQYADEFGKSKSNTFGLNTRCKKSQSRKNGRKVVTHPVSSDHPWREQAKKIIVKG